MTCRCVYQREDEAGGLGVALTKDIVSVSARALQRNLTLLGPLVLPVSEQARFAIDWLMRSLAGRKGKPYVPDFRTAFTHFCLHAGRQAHPHLQTPPSLIVLAEHQVRLLWICYSRLIILGRGLWDGQHLQRSRIECAVRASMWHSDILDACLSSPQVEH